MLCRLPMVADTKPSIEFKLQCARGAVRPHNSDNSHNVQRLQARGSLGWSGKYDAVVLSLFALTVVAAVQVHETNTAKDDECCASRCVLRRYDSGDVCLVTRSMSSLAFPSLCPPDAICKPLSNASLLSGFMSARVLRTMRPLTALNSAQPYNGSCSPSSVYHFLSPHILLTHAGRFFSRHAFCHLPFQSRPR